MQQGLPITPAQEQAGNTSQNLLNEFVKPYIHCMDQKRLLKKRILQLN